MSLLDGLKQFKEFSKGYSNIYEAVRDLGLAARKLCNDMYDVPLHSEAISWILSGDTPDLSEKIEQAKTIKIPMIGYMEELLNYVDDEDIKQSVRDSINASRTRRNLVFLYTTSDESKQTRIRVIARLIWFKFIPKEK